MIEQMAGAIRELTEERDRYRAASNAVAHVVVSMERHLTAMQRVVNDGKTQLTGINALGR